jgi:hypothetical protein
MTRNDPMPHFAGWTAAAVAGLAAVVLSMIFSGCTPAPRAAPPLDARSTTSAT